jgi:hypothetical protein
MAQLENNSSNNKSQDFHKSNVYSSDDEYLFQVSTPKSNGADFIEQLEDFLTESFGRVRHERKTQTSKSFQLLNK